MSMEFGETPLSIVIADASSFRRFLKQLDVTERSLVEYSLELILATLGKDLLIESDWLLGLGGGLYEFRIGPTTTSVYVHLSRHSGAFNRPAHRKILIRVFLSFVNDELIVLAGAYDKLADNSKRRQQLEIQTARDVLAQYLRDC